MRNENLFLPYFSTITKGSLIRAEDWNSAERALTEAWEVKVESPQSQSMSLMGFELHILHLQVGNAIQLCSDN